MLWVLQVITPHPQIPVPLPQPTPIPSTLSSPSSAIPSTQSSSSLFPLLNSVLQANIIQRVRVFHMVIQS